MKLFFSIFIIALVISGFLFLHLRGNRLEKQFYKMRINSLVTKRSDWQKRSIDYYLNNGVVLNFVASEEEKLKVGDSIRKDNDTFKYDVYRKDISGRYKLFATYKYNNH